MAGGAQATTIYTYTGVNFDATPPWDESGGGTSPFTTAMSNSGSITLAIPLAPNLVHHNLLPSLESGSFTNGVHVFSHDDAYNPFFRMLVSTNANGAIVAWDIMLATHASIKFLGSCGKIGSAAATPMCEGRVDGNGNPDWTGEIYHGWGQSSQIGSWAAVPEPSTGLLVALGLTCLAAKGRRRNRS